MISYAVKLKLSDTRQIKLHTSLYLNKTVILIKQLWYINTILIHNYLSSSATCFKSEFISSFWEFNVSFVFKRVSSCAFRELSSLLILSFRALFSSVKVLYFSRTVTNSVAAAASMISLALCSCLDSCEDYYDGHKLDFLTNSIKNVE